MAPKKKPLKVKKKGKPKDAAKGQTSALPYVSEREQYLQKEYAILTEHIKTYTQHVRHFQWENKFLDKEAQQIREISRVYISYLNRRTLRCQNAIISLNDQNLSDLAQIRKQKAELTSQYLEKEKEVRHQLIEMETKLSLINKEIEAMKPYQELQLEQLTRIRELEKELLVMKVQHTEQMHKVKSQFLQQTAEYEMQSQQKVQALARLAEKEAVRSLIQHTKQVKTDNWRLRHELLNLIRQAKVLKSFLLQLREHQQQLLREHQYREDLAHMRKWLRHRGRRLVIPTGSSFRCIPSERSRLISPQTTSSKMFIAKEQEPESQTSVLQTKESLPLTPRIRSRITAMSSSSTSPEHTLSSEMALGQGV
ncbi:coiled-coil domain-containing protein 166 [Rhineura floridana]|uniref:coiled-coil domain-containing protein 166 n=1 Tax=Rhineura floridana TaxID=261503 RepID=UPI002AC85C72|nr:coiled-coil domain-containing protein 166 [Rhineura floridana]